MYLIFVFHPNNITVGRRGVNADYIDGMLQTKILVVTQRDYWEDHYRLFEALISGAMVMTDRMLSLPAGLENGTSLIEFISEEDLRAKIHYYLQNTEKRLEIAREGRLVSMTKHRSWHRIEEIIFGEALSKCRQPSDEKKSPCPWVVHGNETR